MLRPSCSHAQDESKLAQIITYREQRSGISHHIMMTGKNVGHFNTAIKLQGSRLRKAYSSCRSLTLRNSALVFAHTRVHGVWSEHVSLKPFGCEASVQHVSKVRLNRLLAGIAQTTLCTISDILTSLIVHCHY